MHRSVASLQRKASVPARAGDYAGFQMKARSTGEKEESIMNGETFLSQQKEHPAFQARGKKSEVEIGLGDALEERGLMKRLKERDEKAFIQLVEKYHASLLHLARRYVSSQSSAEEIVQETWIGVFQGLPSFEERSSLKTWIFRILTNRAQTCALREKRLLPFSALVERQEETSAGVSEPESLPSIGPFAPGSWISLTRCKDDIPEERLLSIETRARIARTMAALPINQRTVMVLHDIEGRKPAEICHALGISPVNQRVLLSRAHARVRQALEKYFGEA